MHPLNPDNRPTNRRCQPPQTSTVSVCYRFFPADHHKNHPQPTNMFMLRTCADRPYNSLALHSCRSVTPPHHLWNCVSLSFVCHQSASTTAAASSALCARRVLCSPRPLLHRFASKRKCCAATGNHKLLSHISQYAQSFNTQYLNWTSVGLRQGFFCCRRNCLSWT